jgi:hypothetical protein
MHEKVIKSVESHFVPRMESPDPFCAANGIPEPLEPKYTKMKMPPCPGMHNENYWMQVCKMYESIY